MKVSLAVFALASLVLCSCTTLSNRRDLYSPQPVMGPYTQMLKNGIPKKHTVVILEKKESQTSGKEVIPSQR